MQGCIWDNLLVLTDISRFRRSAINVLVYKSERRTAFFCRKTHCLDLIVTGDTPIHQKKSRCRHRDFYCKEREILFSTNGEQRKLQLENLIAIFIFFGNERDFFAEGIDAFHDAFVALLADAERKPGNMARTRRVAID